MPYFIRVGYITIDVIKYVKMSLDNVDPAYSHHQGPFSISLHKLSQLTSIFRSKSVFTVCA